MKVMIVGAHALDAELMAGGAAACYAFSGHEVHLVHLTRGERGLPDKDPTEYARQLDGEIQAAAAAIGAQAMWLGYPAGNLPVCAEVSSKLARLIRSVRPRVLITHWRGSWHPRHVSTHRNVMAALSLAASGEFDCDLPPHRVDWLLFGENCEDTDGFCPMIYIDVTDAFDRWMTALNAYELYRRSVVPCCASSSTIPYDAFYRSLARVRGIEAGCRYAQAFAEGRRLVDAELLLPIRWIGGDGLS